MTDSPTYLRPINILIVEDNPGDVRLIQEILKEGGIPNTLVVAKDGGSAITMLTGRESLEPDLILLDLNLPKRNGLEVLSEIKNHPKSGRIPVVIVTSSSSDDDKARCHQLHASAYLTKPIELAQFKDMIRTINTIPPSTTQQFSK